MYSETENRHLRVAHFDPRDPWGITSAREAAELLGGLVIENIRDGAEIRTVEEWARHAAHHGRLAQDARDEAIRAFAREYAADERTFAEALRREP